MSENRDTETYTVRTLVRRRRTRLPCARMFAAINYETSRTWKEKERRKEREKEKEKMRFCQIGREHEGIYSGGHAEGSINNPQSGD